MADDGATKRLRDDGEDAQNADVKRVKVEGELQGPLSSTEAIITNPVALEPEASSATVEASSAANPSSSVADKPSVKEEDANAVKVEDGTAAGATVAPESTSVPAIDNVAGPSIANNAENAAGTKRARDDDQEEEEGGKKAKTDGGPDDDSAMGSANPEEGEKTATTPAQKPGPDRPVKIGFKTFQNGGECRKYYNRLLQNLSLDQDLNEYEFEMVSQLIIKGHPDANRKVGSGITRIQVKKETYEGATTNVFLMMRKDGTTDDVSVRKCIFKLFPAYAMEAESKEGGKQRTGGRGKGRGRGRGRGRARRGS